MGRPKGKPSILPGGIKRFTVSVGEELLTRMRALPGPVNWSDLFRRMAERIVLEKEKEIAQKTTEENHVERNGP